MPRILIVTKWYPSDENLTHGLFVKEFVKATALHNDVVVLYGELTSYRNPRLPYDITDQVEDGFRTIRFIYKRRLLKLHRIINIIGFAHCFLKLMKEGYRPDIIHFHEYDASLSVFILAKIYHFPLVITEHYSGFVRNILTRSERYFARLVMRQAIVVLPVSDYLRGHLRIYAPNVRMEVVNNIVDTKIFQLSNPIVKGRDQAKQMLIVAALEATKGITYLLEALGLLKIMRTDFFLNIIGNGTLRVELEEKAKILGLNDFVHFHGIKPKPEVARFMSQCDFFVLSSLFETFGCVIIEAMACGKPVVVTNVGGPVEIVKPESGILVESANPEALKDGINYMLDNYYKYSATDISRHIGESYSLEYIGQKLNQIYKDILSGSIV
jgi:glycosyltransferase involved in cell wall biosynthesis